MRLASLCAVLEHVTLPPATAHDPTLLFSNVASTGQRRRSDSSRAGLPISFSTNYRPQTHRCVFVAPLDQLHSPVHAAATLQLDYLSVRCRDDDDATKSLDRAVR